MNKNTGKKLNIKAILIILAIFCAISAIAALLDEGWLRSTLSGPEEGFGWLLGGMFGSVILYFLGKGAISLWYIMSVRFTVTRGERFLLLGLLLAAFLYFAADGLVDSSAGFAAALFLSALSALALFWLWRRAKDLAGRLAHADRYRNITNAEYFALLGVALLFAVWLLSLEPDMFRTENLALTVPAAFLLFVVFGVILYWAYVALKSIVRGINRKGREMEYADGKLAYYGSTRTFYIPLAEIAKAERIETYAGLGAIPTLYVRAHTSEMLLLTLFDTETRIMLPWPGDDETRELCSRAKIPFPIDPRPKKE